MCLLLRISPSSSSSASWFQVGRRAEEQGFWFPPGFKALILLPGPSSIVTPLQSYYTKWQGDLKRAALMLSHSNTEELPIAFQMQVKILPMNIGLLLSQLPSLVLYSFPSQSLSLAPVVFQSFRYTRTHLAQTCITQSTLCQDCPSLASTPPVQLIPQSPLHACCLQGSVHGRCLAQLRPEVLAQCSKSAILILSQHHFSDGLEFYCPVCLLIHSHEELFPLCATGENCSRLLHKATRTLTHSPLSCFLFVCFLASENSIDFWRGSAPPVKCFSSYFIQRLGYFETGGLLSQLTLLQEM